MKLTIPHDQFAAVVAFATRALPARPPVPVMAGLKLTANDGQLAVTGFDYEVSAYTTAAAHVADPGSVLVSGRLLSDITRTLKHDVHLSTDNTRAVLESGSARFTLHTLPLEEFPALPVAPTASGTVSGTDFAAAVAQVATAAGRDDTLPALTGIRVTVDGDLLTLAATDRYRFAVRSLPWNPLTDSPDDHHALVPARTLLDTAKALVGDHDVTVALPGEQSIFGLTGESCRTTTRVLDDDLPKYRTVFPTEFTATATARIDALADAAKRVALVAERSLPLRLHFEGGSLTIEAGSSDDAQAVDRVDATITGADTFDVAFSPAYLLDGLAALEGERVQFNLVTPTKPALLHAVDAPASSLQYLLMPIRLSG